MRTQLSDMLSIYKILDSVQLESSYQSIILLFQRENIDISFLKDLSSHFSTTEQSVTVIFLLQIEDLIMKIEDSEKRRVRVA